MRKRDRTRALLVQCAAELVGRKGFEGTTLEEVAQLAGVTRGAIYSSFKSRDDLFLAVAESLWRPVAPALQEGASLAEHMDALADGIIEALPERRARAVGASSFITYAIRNETLRTKIARANANLYSDMAGVISTRHELPMPAGDYVRVVHALIEGIFLLGSLTPELFPDGTIRAAFRALAR